MYRIFVKDQHGSSLLQILMLIGITGFIAAAASTAIVSFYDQNRRLKSLGAAASLTDQINMALADEALCTSLLPRSINLTAATTDSAPVEIKLADGSVLSEGTILSGLNLRITHLRVHDAIRKLAADDPAYNTPPFEYLGDLKLAFELVRETSPSSYEVVGTSGLKTLGQFKFSVDSTTAPSQMVVCGGVDNFDESRASREACAMLGGTFQENSTTGESFCAIPTPTATKPTCTVCCDGDGQVSLPSCATGCVPTQYRLQSCQNGGWVTVTDGRCLCTGSP